MLGTLIFIRLIFLQFLINFTTGSVPLPYGVQDHVRHDLFNNKNNFLTRFLRAEETSPNPIPSKLWDVSSRSVNNGWDQFLGNSMQDRCSSVVEIDRGRYTNKLLLNKLVTISYPATKAINAVASPDIRNFLRQAPGVIKAIINKYREQSFMMQSKYVAKTVLLLWRWEYYILGSAIAMFLIWVILLVTSGEKGRRCLGKLFCNGCFGHRTRVPFREFNSCLGIIYTVCFFLLILGLPLVTLISLLRYTRLLSAHSNALSCYSYQTPMNFLYGAQYGRELPVLNRHDITIYGEWVGLTSVVETLSRFENFIGNENVKDSALFTVNNALNLTIEEIKGDNELRSLRLNNLASSLANSSKINTIKDLSHRCLICDEAAEVVDAESGAFHTFKETLKPSETQLNNLRLKILDRIESSFDMKNIRLNVKNWIDNFLNQSEILSSYFTSLQAYEPPAKRTIKYASYVFNGIFIIGFLTLLSSVGIIAGTAINQLDVSPKSTPTIRGLLRGCWLWSGFLAFMLFLFAAIGLLVADFGAQPCVLGIDDLLKKGLYGEYPIISDSIGELNLLKNVTDREQTVSTFLSSFLTFDGDANISKIYNTQGLTDSIKKHYEKAITFFETEIQNHIPASDNVPLALLNFRAGYILPDYESLLKSSESNEVVSFPEVLLSGLFKSQTLIPEEIRGQLLSHLKNSPLENQLLSSGPSVLYGLEDIQNAINKFLQDNNIIEKVRYWCLDYYSLCSQLREQGKAPIVISEDLYKNSKDANILYVLDNLQEQFAADRTTSKDQVALNLDKIRFQNAISMASKKVALLKEVKFPTYPDSNDSIVYVNFYDYVVAPTGYIPQTISYLTEAGPRRLKIVKQYMKRKIYQLYGLTRQFINVFIGFGFSSKAILLEAMFGIDAFCYGVVGDTAEIFMICTVLGICYVVATCFMYKLWHYYVDLDYQERVGKSDEEKEESSNSLELHQFNVVDNTVPATPWTRNAEREWKTDASGWN